MKSRLTWLIPLILMLVSIISSALIYLHEIRENKQRIEQMQLREIGLAMAQLQSSLYRRLSAGDETEALLSLSQAAMRPEMIALILADEQHRVVLSNRDSWKGDAAATHSHYSEAAALQVVQSGVSELAYHPTQDALLQGYYPLVVSYQRGGLQKQRGVLYVETDAASLLSGVRRESLENSLGFAAINLLAAALIAWLLHRLVCRRVNALAVVAERIAAGDYAVRSDLAGNDELAALGKSFNLMADSVADNIRLREKATFEQKRVLETMVDGYWLLDKEGGLRDVNEAYLRMSGYSRAALLGKSIPELAGEDVSVQSIRAQLDVVIARGSDRFETKHRHHNGGVFDVEISAHYWPDTGEFFGFIRDISERKQAQIALAREHERLTQAQKIACFGSWELDLDANQLSWSEGIFQLFEIDQDRFAATYEAFLNAVHPDDRAAVNQAYTQSLLDKQPYQISHRLQMPDGRIKWVEERCSTTFDASGKALRSLGTVQDVSEREAREESLRIAAVAFNTQEAIFVTDKHANIIRVNRAFETITGYAEAEVLGKNPRILSAGLHDKAFYQQMWAAINTTGHWSGEVWDRRKEGAIYPKWLTITAVRHLGCVTHYVAVFIDITERKKAEEEIVTLAFFDPLTHMPNRRMLLEHLRLAMGKSARNKNQCALMFLDIDHFKVLNDTKGHEFGDKLLIEVARRLSACLRDIDSVARFGGDEFVVLLEGLNPQRQEAAPQVARIAEKIRQTLAQPYDLDGVAYQSSSSIGVVLFDGDAVAMDELLKQADLAMYQAKAGGRNLVRFFEPAMQAVLESRTVMENALRQALSKGELELHYQLQTNNARDLLGAEVLLRWNSAELGAVSPVQFIPVAEQSRLILPIGHWVLEMACRQLKTWERHPVLGAMHLAVNVSPVQFHQADFVDQVKAVLQQTGANPHLLELELTENLVLEDVSAATRKMIELRAIGVRFSMDDFGTGYSSLQYIKRLPIDQLKIDRTFVRDILTDPGDAVMVQTIADLARNFGFEVIAEGVETSDQLPSLTQLGCSTFQGYLFSKPIGLADFEHLVAHWDAGDGV